MEPVDDSETVARDWPLFGLYRVRNVPPGFAIPLFRGGDDAAYAQISDGKGRIAGFQRVNITESIVFEPPDTSKPCLARVGDRLLYAFHKPDGSFHIGPRASVEDVVRGELHKLRAWPFTWQEAAKFAHDEEQLRLATIETDRLLRRPDSYEFDPGVGGPT